MAANRKSGLVLLLFAAMCRADVTIDIDASAPGTPISPYVYGMNFADWSKAPYIPLTRQGGNRMTAANWENNASNAGHDFHHQSDDYLGGGDTPGEVVRAFVSPAMRRGTSVILTIPMIGHVAADKNPPGDVNQTPDYLNKRFAANFAKKNKPFSDPPDLKDHAVYQDEFVWWLNKRFPSASRRGASIFFALDNEPELWSETHARIHPEKLTYSEIVQRTIDFSGAIKDVAPDATIFGFVSYGYNGYTSLQDAPDGNGRDFVEFFLDSLKQAEESRHRRLVDVLDLHWYPEVKGDGKRITQQTTDPESVRARVQASRSLWDPTFTEKSWITESKTHGPIELITRMKQKIADHYPGTKLAFTEYDYGAIDHISGAIAEADVLGIFGREGVFAAAHWGDSAPFLYSAYKIYLDYDGKGGKFGDVSIPARSSDIAAVSVYASKFSSGSPNLAVVLINRDEQSQHCKIDIKDFPAKRASGYQLAGDQPDLRSIEIPNINEFDLPPMTVTTIVFEK